jgi:hypothetical protein
MYNINPSLWGHHMWKSLHYITLSYPDNPSEEIKLMFKDFFINIIYKFLPCEKCRFNYKKHLKELPLTDEILNSRNKFIFWLVDIHNIVNQETGKRTISYEEFNQIYLNNKETKKENHISLYIIIFLVIILLILFAIYKKFK